MMIVQDIDKLESQLTSLLEKHRKLQEEVLYLRQTIAEREAENRSLDHKLNHIFIKLEQLLARLPHPQAQEINDE